MVTVVVENVQGEVEGSSQFPDEGKGIEVSEPEGLAEGGIADSDHVGDDSIERTEEGEDYSKGDAQILTAQEEDGEPILEPNEHDILNGRGASVNAHRYDFFETLRSMRTLLKVVVNSCLLLLLHSRFSNSQLPFLSIQPN